jgi:hypothetical protein
MRSKSMRMRSKSMRMRSKSMRSRKLRRRMRGGSTAVVPGVTGAGSATTSASGQQLNIPGYAPPPVLNPNAIYDAGARQNNIKGGGRGRARGRTSRRSRKYTYKKQNKQKGGTGSWIDNLYGYKPPPGMMGPIPQPSQTMMTNNLVLDAARISLAGQVDSQYDKNVCSIPNK